MSLVVRRVDVDIAGKTGAGASAALAAFAQSDRDRRIAAGEVSGRYETIVDGIEGKREAQVAPSGTIAYRFSGLAEVVAYAVQALVDRSPVLTGLYAKSFRLMIGRSQKLIEPAAFDASKLDGYRSVAIVNIEPYSRKLDVQRDGSRPIKVRVPPAIFTHAAEDVNARYGNTVRASRRYTSTFAGRWKNKSGRTVEYPTLIITLR